MDPLSAINGAITALQNVAKIRDITKHAEAKLAIAELTSQLADAKLLAAALVEENRRLIGELKKALSPTAEVQLGEDGLYFKTDGDGPYCTTCYDARKQLVRVTEMTTTFRSLGRWRCGVCTNKYGGKGI